MIPKTIPLFIIALIVVLFFVPENLLNKVPPALKLKIFIEKTFSQAFNVVSKLINGLLRAFFALRDLISNAYTNVSRELKNKLEALRDLFDALDRLQGKEPR